MKHYKYRRLLFFTTAFIISFNSAFFCKMKACAVEDYNAEAEARKSLPIQTNLLDNWPAGPAIGAQSAILIEANSGTILYAKNIDDKLYPASVTKILTALVAVEHSKLDESVTFSDAAVHSINWKEDANMGISPGDQITMEQTLYGLLVGSANEAAYAIAEHICGDGNVSDFAELMNEKAKSLGCTNSNFVTPNGIHDENHYTTAHDLALIAQAFFSNELLAKMSCTTSYQIPKTSTQPREDMIVWAKSKILPGREYAYDNLVGTKTGFTTQARQTLVSCAKRNGLKLICVIMKEESPNQFLDTTQLFDYGFSNFTAMTIADKDSNYIIDNQNFFSTDNDFFGNSKPILQINPQDYIVLPNNVDFGETESTLSYDDLQTNEIARIHYTYKGTDVGFARVVPVKDTEATFDFGTRQTIAKQEDTEKKTFYINIKNIIMVIVLLAFLLIVAFMFRSLWVNTRKYRRRSSIMRKHSSGKKKLDWKHFK